MTLNQGDAADFEGGPFDAAFVDLREPWLYLDHLRSLLDATGAPRRLHRTHCRNQVSECPPDAAAGVR